MRPIIQALLACFLVPSAFCQTDVLVVGTKPGPQSSCFFEDVVLKIELSGPFGSVDWVNGRQVTPTLAQLSAYDAVLVFADANQFQEPVVLGDNLADYVDAGGGVVVAMSACAQFTYALGGRWTVGYEVIPQAFNVGYYLQEGLGTIEVPGHPVMQGVSTFLGGVSGLFGSPRPVATTVTSGSTIIARWTDDTVLVAEGTTPQRIDLGFLPPSDACIPGLWVDTTDGGLLMANALRYVAGTLETIGDTVCTPAVQNSTGQPGVMQVFGSAVALDNDLTLVATDLPTGEFAYFIASRTPGLVVGPGTSVGNLCVIGQLARFNAQLGPIVGGSFSIDVDLSSVPEPPSGNHTVLAGETWYWQCWFRDVVSAQPTSNFTDSVELLFQ